MWFTGASCGEGSSFIFVACPFFQLRGGRKKGQARNRQGASPCKTYSQEKITLHHTGKPVIISTKQVNVL